MLPTDFVTVARDAVVVFSLVKVLTAPLAVGTVPIGRAVEAVAAVACRVVEGLVKVAPAGKSITIARWKRKEE